MGHVYILVKEHVGEWSYDLQLLGVFRSLPHARAAANRHEFGDEPGFLAWHKEEFRGKPIPGRWTSGDYRIKRHHLDQDLDGWLR